MTHSELTFASGGARLRAFAWHSEAGSDRPWVIMSHGLTNSHADAPVFTELREHLLRARNSVFMFDYFGSGNSEGAFQDKTWANQKRNLADAIQFVDSELRRRSEPVALFGRSVGATLCGFFARDPRIACSVLASPVFHLVRTFGAYRSRAIDGYVQMPSDVERSGQIRGEWKLPEAFFEELRTTEKELEESIRGAQGVLVTHGLEDPKVSPENAKDLFVLLEEPKRLCLTGGDHYYHGAESELVEAATLWIADQTSATGE